MQQIAIVSRRTFLAAPLAAGLVSLCSQQRAIAADGPPAGRLPLMPLSTNFSYWDHHWIQWIDHPVYEAIEVALAERSEAAQPLVRLWLTERAEGKRQVYYFNDEAVARTFPQESHVAEFAVAHEAEPGFARNLTLAFTDKEGVPIRWAMRFPASQSLSTERAGLKPQNGHGARMVLLFWYVDRRADGGDARLTFGEDEYAVRDSAARVDTRHRAAYNQGACVGVISYGSAKIAAADRGFRSGWSGGRLFEPRPSEGGTTYVAAGRSFGRGSTIEIEYDSTGALVSYRHSHGGRAMQLVFSPPLAAGGQRSSRFRLAIDGDPIAHGNVAATGDVARGAELRWEIAEPEWAREVGLRTLITAEDNGGYAMRVAPLH